MAKIPDAGTPAPDFTLPALTLVDGTVVRDDKTLSDHRGRPVVLAFYPGDDTAVCTKQMCAYNSELERFTGLDALVWGISPQGIESHEAFARRYGLAFPLLADVGRSVIDEYGLVAFGIGVRRSVFVIDGDGMIRWRYVGKLGLNYPDASVIAEQVAAASV